MKTLLLSACLVFVTCSLNSCLWDDKDDVVGIQGQYWVPLNGPVNGSGGPTSVYCLTFATDGTLYAGASTGQFESRIFRSNDNGASWTMLRRDTGDNCYSGIACIGSGTVVANTVFNDDGGNEITSVVRSTDKGNSWTVLSTPWNIQLQDYFFATTSQGTLLAAVMEQRSNVMHAFRSTDLATSWSEVTSGSNGSFPCVIGDDGTTLYSLGTQGLYQSANDGMSWSTLTTAGLPSTNVEAIAIPGPSLMVGATYGQGFYRSTDHGATWTKSALPYADGMLGGVQIAGRGNLLAATSIQYSGSSGRPPSYFLHSPDQGKTWIAENTSGIQYAIRCIAIGPDNHAYFGGEYGVMRSMDPLVP